MDFTGLLDRFEAVRQAYRYDPLPSAHDVRVGLDALKEKFDSLMNQATEAQNSGEDSAELVGLMIFMALSTTVEDLERMLARREQVKEELLMNAPTCGNA